MGKGECSNAKQGTKLHGNTVTGYCNRYVVLEFFHRMQHTSPEALQIYVENVDALEKKRKKSCYV